MSIKGITVSTSEIPLPIETGMTIIKIKNKVKHIGFRSMWSPNLHEILKPRH